MKRAILVTAALVFWSTTASAGNLILNGDFSQGYADFSSDYTPVATDGTVYTLPPNYAVITNPGTQFTNNYLSFGDHTTGTGQMLFFDGAGPALNIWSQAVTLAADTSYVFSYYATTPDGGTPTGSELGDLAVKLNGTGLGDTVITGQGASGWQLVSDSFKTTGAGSYTLAISDLNAAAFDNDDVIDDISLVGNPPPPPPPPPPPSVPEPASWAMFIGGFGVVGASLRRRQRTVAKLA